MTINLEIENDFQQKIMTQSFSQRMVITDKSLVQSWRSQWMMGLSSWHSPYKLVIDCRKVSVTDSPEIKEALELMIKFFKGFFLRKVVGFGYVKEMGHDLLPFDVLKDETEAYIAIGLRQAPDRTPGDFRSQIQLQNHFQTHVVELNFAHDVIIDDKEKVQALKSKLTNNLMQWHSKWSLIVDCSKVDFSTEVHPDLELMFKSLKGFFMKQVIGYSPRGDKNNYPFPTYRSRHRAAAALDAEGNVSGDDANCRSRS